MKRIAIIGGGIAGLACATELNQEKFSISIFDKGSGKGGRVSTRRNEDYHFDHGAQYISETDSPFKLELENWMKLGLLEKWNAELGELKGNRFVNTFVNKSVFVGVPKMSAIGNHLASKLDHVEFNNKIKITEVFKKFNEWYLMDADDEIYGGFDFIVFTIPPPQAKEILKDFDYLIDILDQVKISPRWAVMIGLKYRLNVSYDAVFVNNMRKNPEFKSPIRWMARNNSKPGRPKAESWVVHASKEWSEEHLEKDADWVADELYKEFLDITGFESYDTEFHNAHRWRFAIVDRPLDQNFVLDNNRNIALAGDFCIGNNIEAAYLSGETLGQRLNSLRI